MARPVVGIICNSHLLDETYEVFGAGTINTRAISEVSDCIPLLIAADPELLSVQELMETCDGFC